MKRRHSSDEDKIDAEMHSGEAATENVYLSMFMGFRDQLDKHHDRRERVIKASRDITALSKKIIFSLQRTKHIGHELPPAISKDLQGKFAEIRELYASIAPDLRGQNEWRYHRSISPAIQEFIEAQTFLSFLTKRSLLNPEQLNSSLSDELHITLSDYTLGIFDLTGELMRFAIANLGTPGSDGDLISAEICALMRGMRQGFESLDVQTSGGSSLGNEIGKKLATMRSSVEKVEACRYSMAVRGKERPKGWRPDERAGQEQMI